MKRVFFRNCSVEEEVPAKTHHFTREGSRRFSLQAALIEPKPYRTLHLYHLEQPLLREHIQQIVAVYLLLVKQQALIQPFPYDEPERGQEEFLNLSSIHVDLDTTESTHGDEFLDDRTNGTSL